MRNPEDSRKRLVPTLSSVGLDEIDLKIVSTLQEAGRTKRNELAEEVKLSIPAVSERLRKLEERGILTGFHAKLDPKLSGLDVAAFIFVSVDSSSHYPQFLESAKSHPEVLEIHAVTGDGSHLLKVRTWNTSTLERLLGEIQRWPGVKQTRTNVVLSTPKETMSLPLKELDQNSKSV